MENFITKEESWVLSDYESAYETIMDNQEKHRKKLEDMIIDYYQKNKLFFSSPDFNTDFIYTNSVEKISKMESAFQLVRIMKSKLEIDESISILALSYNIIESMYGVSAIYKHRDDYTLWIDFLVGWYFNRITQLEVDDESVGIAE